MSAIKRGKKWWVEFRLNYNRFRKPSPENSRAGAIAYEAMVRQKISRGEKIFEEIEVKQKKLFGDFAWEWFRTYVEANNKPSEIKTKKSTLTVHLIPFFKKKRLDEINSFEIEKFKMEKIKQGLKAKTINNIIGILGKCLSCAEEWELLDKIPRIKPLKTVQAKFDHLDVGKCNLLIDNATGFMKDLILLAWKTGLRFGELIALTWNDVNFIDRYLEVNKAVARGILGSTKSYRSRIVFLSSDVVEMLERRKLETGNDLIFPNKHGKYLNQAHSLDWLANVCKKAGMRKITWHTFRHTFASQLSQRGVNITIVKELLGHTDIRTTMRYSHMNSATLRDAVRIFEIPRKNFHAHNMPTINNFNPILPIIFDGEIAENTANNKTKTAY